MSDDKTIIADPVGHTIFNPPKQRQACLVQYSGQAIGRRYLLAEAEVTVGRLPDNGVVIDEASVSRHHAKFISTTGRVDIEDLRTTNGTFVNDKRIEQPIELRDGDIIRLGTILLKYFAHDNIENVFHDKIYRMATIDAGTQIFNKKYLLESLETEFRFSRTYNRPLSIIYYDLDFFKKVNDTHGHNAGDFILRESAELTNSVIRKEDIFGRFGGEEFIVILPGTASPPAIELAERIRKACEVHVFEFNNEKLRQTISLGVSELGPQMNEPKDLMDSADKKLYHSKNSGRNRVTY